MTLNELIDDRLGKYALDGDHSILDKYGFLFHMIATDHAKAKLEEAAESKKELCKLAYLWGRDNGEGRSEKNFNDFMETTAFQQSTNINLY